MRSAVIVAGGKGVRMGSETPKQFLLLGNKPILMHTIKAFYEAGSTIRIVVVLPEEQADQWSHMVIQHSFSVPHLLCPGGPTRFHSVKNGLQQVPDEGLVAIHDGVRPLVTPTLINDLFRLAAEHGNAIPVIPVTESIRALSEAGNRPVSRTDLRLVQTPQVFRSANLKRAYSVEYNASFTDDATVLESSGEKIFLAEGDPVNIKVTSPPDLVIAQALLRRPFH